MILRFPSLDSLKLALTSGVIGEEIQGSSARVAQHDDESWLIEPSVSVSRATMAELKKLGVEKKRSVKADFQNVTSWHQAIPLSSVNEQSLGDKTEVLFDAAGDDLMTSVVAEMLRQGNDRQSFRHVEQEGDARALIRVTSPPYYTMLRAIDAVGRDLRAYVQQSPRVWVQVGYRHPLGEQIKPAPGQWLLINDDQPWQILDEGPFRDIYEILEFSLPHLPASFQDRELSQRIRIPLSLAFGGTEGSAELWVLTRDAMAQTEALVRRSDDRLISRLAFAVSERGGEDDGPVVVIRARPSKSAPPVLVLDGVACQPYLKIPNLFVPVGGRLHPPLRRDAVSNLLASDGQQIHWLMPTEETSFIPQSIADGAFRPLSDWVDYVLDHEHEPLQAWIAAHRFDFESFVCRDETKPKKPRKKKANRETTDVSEPAEQDLVRESTQKKLPLDKNDSQPSSFVTSTLKKKKPQQLQTRLRELESAFLESSEPLDSPARAALWQDMALTNAALGHRHDMTVCWASALWDPDAAGETSLKTWLETEQQLLPIDSVTKAEIERLCTDSKASASHASLLAAYVIWAATEDPIPDPPRALQSAITQFLERHENRLPVRVVWMAWFAMYQISGGDDLLLARARDRVLARLFRQGLTPELDMAGFMRTGATQGTDRFRVLSEHLTRLHQTVSTWIEEPESAKNPQTSGYADLMFAFALAKLGESLRCHEMLEELASRLDDGDAIHSWVYHAFRYRIQQTLAGESSYDPLPDELLEPLDSLDRSDRYRLDKLRQRLNILEPHVRINPYINWHGAYDDELSRQVAELQGISNLDQLSSRIEGLLKEHSDGKDRLRLLPGILEASARVGERFSVAILDHVPAAIDTAEESIGKAVVLQQALFIAAHYGRVDYVQPFLQSLTKALPEIVREYFALSNSNPDLERVQRVESLFVDSLRGLRKLGMREEIGDLYASVADLIASQPTLSARERKKAGHHNDLSRPYRLQLCVAGGWYYYGHTERAQEIADRVRDILFAGDIDQNAYQKNLARAYLSAVAQAPVEESLARIEELFSVTKSGAKRLPNVNEVGIGITSSHFAIMQLEVVESAVLSLVSEDLSLNAEAKRWLDEDEFIVRSRIHRDLRTATGT